MSSVEIGAVGRAVEGEGKSGFFELHQGIGRLRSLPTDLGTFEVGRGRDVGDDGRHRVHHRVHPHNAARGGI